MAGDLTKNFSLYEFRQRNPMLPVPWVYRANVQRLANQLQALRDELGTAITINSGWRSLAKNTAINGARTSQHLTAKAADFIVPGVSKAFVWCIIEHLTANGQMEEGGLGWYGAGGHIHYDVRGFKRRWNKTAGPLPVCPKIPPPEEDDTMAKAFKTSGSNTVYVHSGTAMAVVRDGPALQRLQKEGLVGKAKVVSAAYIRQLQKDLLQA